jgi:DNA-binding XRE family transcriptional regulator
MQNLYKTIRTYCQLSRQEFASELGVTLNSINRWENDKANPNKAAQNKLYTYCKNNDVPIYNMTIQRIKKLAQDIDLDKNRILLYHGSKSGLSGKIAPISRSKCDFGAGFYMGTEPEQPLTLTCDFPHSKFCIVSVALDELTALEVPVNLEWAMVIAYNRGKMENIKGTTMYEKYRELCAGKDIIVGRIADDRMFYVLDNFFLGNITDLALVNSLSALPLGKQYVATTQRACDTVRIEKEIFISDLERRFLQDISEENRKKGISLANSICKTHRRDGQFFDEILDKAREELL